MDSRNLEEQRLGGMGQCAKAVLKVLRKVVEKSVKKVSSEFSLFFQIFEFSRQNSHTVRNLHFLPKYSTLIFREKC